MAEAQIHQWNVLCTLCDSPADHYCNTCGDVLCSRCRDGHLRSHATSDHVVVPYAEGIEPQKASSIKCSIHQNQTSEIWCKTCNISICEKCVTSNQHRGHEFDDMQSQLSLCRKQLQEEMDKQTDTISKWETLLSDSKQMSKSYLGQMDNQEADIIARGDEICSEVRIIQAKYQKQIHTIKTEQLPTLRATTQTVSESLVEIKKDQKEIEDTLRVGEPSALLQESQRLSVHNKPEMPKLNLPMTLVFTPGRLTSQALEQMFGTLVLDQSNQQRNVTQKNQKSSHGKELKILMTPEKSTTSSTMKTTTEDNKIQDKKEAFITSSSVQFTIEMQNPMLSPRISCCRGSDRAWIVDGQNTILLMKRDGKIMETIKTKFAVSNIDTTKQGDIFITDSNTKSIKSISKKKIIATLFMTELSPWGVCCLMNGDILVSFLCDGRVIQYSIGGKVVQELDSTHFSTPWTVAQNEINQDLYVCNKKKNVLLSASTVGQVLIFNKEGILRSKYNGGYTGEFRPNGMCTDSAGHMLIIDYKNKIHILDKDVNFLSFIDTAGLGLMNVYYIDVDGEGYAWIGAAGQISVIKYLR